MHRVNYASKGYSRKEKKGEREQGKELGVGVGG